MSKNNKDENKVTYIIKRGNKDILVSKEEWEQDWLNWWNKTERERKRRLRLSD